MSLLIVGSIALDTVHTPYGKAEDAVGGSAVYGAYAASRMTPVSIVGVVGDDFPAAEMRSLSRCGVNLDGVQRIKGGRTFRWGGRYLDDINKRETLFTELNVFGDFAPRLPKSYRRIPNVFLANIDPELQLDVLAQIEKPRLVVCDTMNLWIDIKRPMLKRLFKRLDCLLLNDEETLMLGESASLTKAALNLRRAGVRRIIVKKGEHGCMMFGPEGVFGAPALPLASVKDPTGAGDTFAGGLTGYLSRHSLTEANWRKAIVVGTALASFCVEDFSTRRLRRLDRAAITKRCEEVRCMMQVGKV